MKNLILTEISAISGGNMNLVADFSTGSIIFIGHCFKEVPGPAQRIFSGIGVDKSTDGATKRVVDACHKSGGGPASILYFYTNDEFIKHMKDNYSENGIEEQNNTLTLI